MCRLARVYKQLIFLEPILFFLTTFGACSETLSDRALAQGDGVIFCNFAWFVVSQDDNMVQGHGGRHLAELPCQRFGPV